jgi:hypothetical protein
MRGPIHCLAPVLALTFLLGNSALSESEVPANPDIDPETIELLDATASFLASRQNFSVTSETSYEVLQKSGQMIEFGATRRSKVKRPDKLLIIAEDREGEQRGVLFDGSQLTIYDIDENVYATVARPGDIDDAVEYLAEELQTPTPLAEFFYNQPQDTWKKGLTSARYVADEKIDGTPCAHLAFRNENVDFQIWIALGNKPLPVRVVIHYKHYPGMPQFRAEFRKWNLSAKHRDKDFIFKPADGAEKIPFAAHTPLAEEEAEK